MKTILHCVRCGSDKNIEIHHIKQRVEGGTNDLVNLEPRCRACHDFEHARRFIFAQLSHETQPDREHVLLQRLSLLESLNTPALVIERGFRGYWTEYKVPLPPKRAASKNHISMVFPQF